MIGKKPKIGDLIILNKDLSFLDEKWQTDKSFYRKTIRPWDHIIVKKNTPCTILDKDKLYYKVLILTEDLSYKILVIFTYSLENNAEILNEHTGI